MIPGLENAEFARLGVMHRNTFLNSPGFLDDTYRVISQPRLAFAGQITGVEGYVESAASGLMCGLSAPLEMRPGEKRIRNKQQRYEKISERALLELDLILGRMEQESLS